MPPVGTDRQWSADFENAVRRPCADACYSAAHLDEVSHFSLHLQVKCGISPALLGDEVQEVPLRHQGQKMAVRRQMGEIRKRDGFIPHLAAQFTYLLMRAFQELVQNAELMHDFKCRRMDRVAAEITQKIRVFFEHENVNALARKRRPSITPAGPPPAMQQRVWMASSTQINLNGDLHYPMAGYGLPANSL